MSVAATTHDLRHECPPDDDSPGRKRCPSRSIVGVRDARAAHRRVRARAGFRRRELPPLFPDHARGALARTCDADRHGRAAADGRLPPLRPRGGAAAQTPASTRRRCSRTTSEHGFLLLTDLGTRTYLAALDAKSAPALYSDATDALIRWQQATRDGALPPYDEALLARELALFPDWYVAKHLGVDARRRRSSDVLAERSG